MQILNQPFTVIKENTYDPLFIAKPNDTFRIRALRVTKTIAAIALAIFTISHLPIYLRLSERRLTSIAMAYTAYWLVLTSLFVEGIFKHKVMIPELKKTSKLYDKITETYDRFSKLLNAEISHNKKHGAHQTKHLNILKKLDITLKKILKLQGVDSKPKPTKKAISLANKDPSLATKAPSLAKKTKSLEIDRKFKELITRKNPRETVLAEMSKRLDSANDSIRLKSETIRLFMAKISHLSNIFKTNSFEKFKVHRRDIQIYLNEIDCLCDEIDIELGLLKKIRSLWRGVLAVTNKELIKAEKDLVDLEGSSP
jgi:hypothetical protein